MLPARLVSNFFIVESKWDDGKSYRFLIDTGSSATLVSSDLARRFALKQKKGTAPARVTVRSANGGTIDLDQVTLRRVALGATTFDGVPALVFDFTDLSGHLGLRIDGIIGFPVFRDTLLTLEAMKMQAAVCAERDAEVAEVLVGPGRPVDAKDLLLTLR